MTMVDMSMSAEEAKEEYGSCAPAAGNAPKYPYGLEISLNEESIAKLGLTQLPTVGSTFTITAKCEVSSTSERQTQDGEAERNVSLQITAMQIGEGGATSESPDLASLLYGA